MRLCYMLDTVDIEPVQMIKRADAAQYTFADLLEAAA